MAGLRILVFWHRRLAALIILLALCLKVVVPPGYMVHAGSKIFSVLVCADSEHRQTTMKLVLPAAPRDRKAPQQGPKSEGLCPFATFSVPALAAADPVLLAVAIAFVMGLGFIATAAPMARGAKRLRPPLRGPPQLA